MVALSPRFSVLAGFVTLASLCAAPLSVGAAVIPRAGETANVARNVGPSMFQTAFRLSQAKAAKREDCEEDVYPYSYADPALAVIVGRDHELQHSVRGKSYTVSHNPKHSRDNAGGEKAAQPELGKMAVENLDDPSDKTQPFLTVGKNEYSEQDKSYPVRLSPSENDASEIALTTKPDAPRDENGLDVVNVITSLSGEELCLSFKGTDNRTLSFAQCGTRGWFQDFGRDEKTNYVYPLSTQPSSTETTEGSQKILSRDDGGQHRSAVLKFIPKAPNAAQSANVKDVAAAADDGSSTATMTKTVTVTNTSMASSATDPSTASTSTANAAALEAASTSGAPGATPTADLSSSASTSLTSTVNGAAATSGAPTPTADVSSSASTSLTSTVTGATPTAEALEPTKETPVVSSSASTSSTSTVNGAAPTGTPGTPGTQGAAAAADVLGVEVVQSSSMPAAPTMSPQDVASSIANSAAASSSTTPGVASPSSVTSPSTSAGSSTRGQ